MRLSITSPVRAFGTIALLMSALSVHAAFDAFLKIEGIPGESKDSHHSEWIRVDSLHFGLAGVSALASTKLSPLTLFKRIDKASPLLSRACATGQSFPQAKLELIRTDSTRTRFYQITLEDVFVSGLSSTAATGGGALYETIELIAGRWSWSYTEFELDGRRLQDHSLYWDVVQNGGEGSVTPAMSASGTQSSTGQYNLIFPAKPGVAYRILGGSDLAGVFSEIRRLQPTAGGETVVELPALGPAQFFLVEELP